MHICTSEYASSTPVRRDVKGDSSDRLFLILAIVESAFIYSMRRDSQLERLAYPKTSDFPLFSCRQHT